jgi:hypothetical protein
MDPMGHNVENTGSEPVRLLSSSRADVSHAVARADTPELVEAHLNLDAKAVAGFSKTKPIIVRG